MGRIKNSKRATGYKNTDDDFFASSALVRNGDYALGKDTWKRIELDYSNRKIDLSSEKEFGFSEEDKYVSSTSNWSKGGVKGRALSSKRK